LQSDETARRGRPGLTAELRDGLPEPSPEEVAPGNTTVLPRLQTAEPERVEAATGRLVTEDGRSFELRRPVTSIGRALENDIVISDSRISRFHLEVRWEQGEYRFRDLGSTNGTRIAEKADGRQTLRDGDVLLLGGYRLVFRQT
jgi:pSer/pThr/pTyr-binding forkhead associated (FHA) protein